MAERKFIDLKALKMADEGAGTIEGYRSVFGEIDEGGDIIVPGAFKGCIADYLHSGFTAESHDWDFGKSVGFPVEAKEDEYGWFVKSQFHSTPDAQNIRTKARERMEAGKQVGFSFGYKTDEYEVIEQKDFKDQLPQFVKADRLEENLKKAQRFSRIRVLKKVSAIEDSLVTSPMNKLAGATNVKSATPAAETKGLFEDVIAECQESLYFLTDKLMTAIYRAQMLDEYWEDSANPFDLSSAIDEILAEFSARVRAAVVGEDANEDTGTEVASFRGPIDFKAGLPAGQPFAKHTETVLATVEVFANRSAAITELCNGFKDRAQSILELRVKEGRTLSTNTLSHAQRVHDALGKVEKDVGVVRADMANLIDKGKKPEKSEPQEKPVESTLDTQALRTQSLKVRSAASVALN